MQSSNCLIEGWQRPLSSLLSLPCDQNLHTSRNWSGPLLHQDSTYSQISALVARRRMLEFHPSCSLSSTSSNMTTPIYFFLKVDWAFAAYQWCGQLLSTYHSSHCNNESTLPLHVFSFHESLLMTTALFRPCQLFSASWSTALKMISEAHRFLRCKILRVPNEDIVHRNEVSTLHVKLNQIKLCQKNLLLFERFHATKVVLPRNNFFLYHKHLIRRTRCQVEGMGRLYLEEISTYRMCYIEPTHDHLQGVQQMRLDYCSRLMHCWLLQMTLSYGLNSWLFSLALPLCHLPQRPERIQRLELSFDSAPFEISEDLDFACWRVSSSPICFVANANKTFETARR